MNNKNSFYLINSVESYKQYADSLLSLLALSESDDEILGFDKNFLGNVSEKYKKYLEKEVATGSVSILVSGDSCRVILCCILKHNFQQTTRHICELQKGFIHPKFRRTGLLEKALAKIASVCMEDSIDLITLDVRENSPAHKIWSKCGFETYGVLKDYARSNGNSFSGHFMAISTETLFNNFHNK